MEVLKNKLIFLRINFNRAVAYHSTSTFPKYNEKIAFSQLKAQSHITSAQTAHMLFYYISDQEHKEKIRKGIVDDVDEGCKQYQEFITATGIMDKVPKRCFDQWMV